MFHTRVTMVITIRFVFLVTSTSALGRSDDDLIMTIVMPNAVSDRADAYMCTYKKLDPRETYITKFIPHATKTIAHHLMVYGCQAPANNRSSWLCNEFESNKPSENAVCWNGERQILFAWAMDAPEKSLPEGVGLRVSGDTGIKYLVLQLHYTKAFLPGVTDSSGISLVMTHTRPPQQVGYLVLGDSGSIPPHEKGYHMDSYCQYQRNYTIYPIGFRTHSHNLGVVTSGYRVRYGRWMEIGRMSPQLPQTFYPVSNPGMDVRYGDILAARCTMNSMGRDDDTPIGLTNHDEMCNFYIMYSTYEQKNLETDYCFSESPSYTWLNSFRKEDIPANSGSLEGIAGADQVKTKFKMI